MSGQDAEVQEAAERSTASTPAKPPPNFAPSGSAQSLADFMDFASTMPSDLTMTQLHAKYLQWQNAQVNRRF